MILKDIISRVIQIVGLEDEIDLDTPSKKLDKLIDSANMIYSELTQEYIHLKTKENVRFSNNRVYYSEFSNRIRDIICVKINGSKVPFTMYPLYMEVDVNSCDFTAEVAYVYYLGELSLEDSLILPPQYTEYLLAVGVASEYLYRIGLVDEAYFYKNRYENSLKNLSRRLTSVKLPVKRMV